MKDVFVAIHMLLKNRKYMTAIKKLLNFDSGKIQAPYNSDLNHAWYVVGDAYYKMGEYELALRGFKNSLRNKKDDFQAMIAVANCYSEIGRPIMTKRYLLKALSTRGIGGKEKEVITYNLGNAYFDLKKYEFAIQEYKKIKKSKSEVYRLARKNIDYINNQKRQLIG